MRLAATKRPGVTGRRQAGRPVVHGVLPHRSIRPRAFRRQFRHSVVTLRPSTSAPAVRPGHTHNSPSRPVVGRRLRHPVLFIVTVCLFRSRRFRPHGRTPDGARLFQVGGFLRAELRPSASLRQIDSPKPLDISPIAHNSCPPIGIITLAILYLLLWPPGLVFSSEPGHRILKIFPAIGYANLRATYANNQPPPLPKAIIGMRSRPA